MPLSLEAQIAQAERTLQTLQTIWNERVKPCHNTMVEIDASMAALVQANT